MFTNLIIQQLPQISLLLDANHVTELTGIVKEINQNTDSWHGMNILFTLISFIAALVTIMGLVMVVYAIVKNKCSNRCQQKIIEDLLRHFFINNAILETIRIRTKDDPELRPIDGVFSRFATLDSDVELGRFSNTAYNYELIHKISLKLRNYNITAKIAEEHFHDKNCPMRVMQLDMEALYSRAVSLTEGLVEMCVELNIKLDKAEFFRYLNSRYGDGYINKDEMIFDNDLTIPEEMSYCYDKEIESWIRKYYKKELEKTKNESSLARLNERWLGTWNFRKEFENAIRQQSKRISFIKY